MKTFRQEPGTAMPSIAYSPLAAAKPGDQGRAKSIGEQNCKIYALLAEPSGNSRPALRPWPAAAQEEQTVHPRRPFQHAGDIGPDHSQEQGILVPFAQGP